MTCTLSSLPRSHVCFISVICVVRLSGVIGLWGPLHSVRPGCVADWRNFASNGAFEMKAKLLKDCISRLKYMNARMQMHNEVDPSVVSEIEAGIRRVEFYEETVGDEVVVDERLVNDVLNGIGKVAVTLTTLTKVIGKFFE